MREQKGDKWKLAETASYGNEAELQKLLAESPSLISVSDIRSDASPLIVAVKEFPLPIGNIDLIAFNPEGDIAIIECKLASNTEVKRKVIGQILEYGANLWEMNYEELDQGIRFRTGSSLIELMELAVYPSGWDEEIFCNNIVSALENGNFILMIVVDEINDELAKIIRYMNANSSLGFDFAALEMRRFQSEKAEMLIPKVFGAVHSAKKLTNNKSVNQWDENTFFIELQKRSDNSGVETARKILEWVKQKTSIWWGKGTQTGSFVPWFEYKGKSHQLFAVYTYGVVETYFYWMSFKPPFDTDEKRLELREKLNSIEGVNIPLDAIKKRPSIPLSLLANETSLKKFLSIYDWVIDEIRKN